MLTTTLVYYLEGDIIESVCILEFMAMPGRPRNHTKFYGYFGFILCKL